MRTTHIKNAHIIDPANNVDCRGDILLCNGWIAEIAPKVTIPADHVIDANGLIAAPGLVDMHVHLRDPGYTYKEDMQSGCRAAAAGGVTTVAAMPNTDPVIDTPERLSTVLRRARKQPIRVKQVAAISHGLGTAELVDFAAMAQAGAVAFSDDGKPVQNGRLLYDALEAAAKWNLPVLTHCEDLDLAGDGIVNAEIARKLDVPGILPAAEDVGTAREILLAMSLDVPVHICHVSTRTSVGIIRAAKAAGARVTAETAPHYFSLTQDSLRDRDANFRMNPPLRTQADVQAVIAGLQDGTLDAIATDHAPHAPAEKKDFLKAPNGIIGLETSLAVGITYLVQPGLLTLSQLLTYMSVNPARILRVPGGSLRVGAVADIVLFDPSARWTVQAERIQSKACNTPYLGRKLTGRVKYTICNGRLIYQDRQKG